MKQRVLSALALAPLAVAGLLWLPTAPLLAVFGALLLLGLWEWSRLIGLRGRLARAVWVALHAALMAWLAWFGWPHLFPVLLLAGAAGWALAALWLTHPMLGRSGTAGFAAKLAAGSLLVLPTWCAMALLHGAGALGPRWALFALVVVWAGDTFAYFVGSRIGGRKLAPVISPSKTWAGFWGALGGALLVCLPALPLLGLSWSQLPWLALLALATALAGVLGDLFESMAKRHAGAKDSGYLIPGHGGVMDRIDSIVAALPAFALGKLWLGL